MARPVGADGEATRRRILETALELFSDHGVGLTSIRDIARAAHVSVAMVHHYFGSKELLYEAVIDAMYAELAGLRAVLFEALADPSKGKDGLGALMERATRLGFGFARSHRRAV